MSTINEKHIMFSYAWEGDHKKVGQIANQCTAAGIPIWMDIRNGFGPNLIDGMAEAVEESLAVCCFMTPEYQESKYCKMELEYANKLNKLIIPCFLTDFQPRKWLGILTAGLIYYDFSYDLSDIVVSQLIKHMKEEILKRKTRISSKLDRLPVKIESQSNSFERNFRQKFASGEYHSNEQKHVLEHRPTADSFVTRDWPMPLKMPTDCFDLSLTDISTSMIDSDMAEINQLGMNFLIYAPAVARQYSETICKMVSECCPQIKSSFISMILLKNAEDIIKECFGENFKFFRNLISCPLLGQATTLGFKSDITKYESIYTKNIIEDIEDINIKLQICSEEELYSIVCDWNGSDLQRRCDRRIFEKFAEQDDQIYKDKVQKIKEAYIKLANELKKEFYY